MPPKHQAHKSSRRQYIDECSPNATSFPRRIPSKGIYKPIPPILQDNDTTPGKIHSGRACITSYTSWHFPEQISAIEARITANRAPACWVDRLGVKQPPGCERKEVKRKEVEIVPVLRSPWDDKREIARLKWWVEAREGEAKQSVDSGYGSGKDLGLAKDEKEKVEEKTKAEVEKDEKQYEEDGQKEVEQESKEMVKEENEEEDTWESVEESELSVLFTEL